MYKCNIDNMSNMSIVLHQFHSLVRLLISKPLAIGRGFRDWMAELAPEAGSEDEWSVFSSMKYVYEWRYVFSHSAGSTNYEFVECINLHMFASCVKVMTSWNVKSLLFGYRKSWIEKIQRFPESLCGLLRLLPWGSQTAFGLEDFGQ